MARFGQRTIKIKDLTEKEKGVTITGSVVLISKILQTRASRPYFFFHLTDDTGNIKCMIWAECAEPLHKELKCGDIVKIIRCMAEAWEGNLQIVTGKYTTVEVHRGNGYIHVFNFQNKKKTTIQGKVEVQKTVAKVANQVNHIAGVAKLTIADLKKAQIYPSIEMKLKEVDHIKTSGTGVTYLNGIGQDDTGEIGITLFQPHAEQFADILKSGLRIELKNFKVKPLNCKRLKWADNDFEINVTSMSNFTILPTSAELKEMSLEYDVYKEESPPDFVENVPEKAISPYEKNYVGEVKSVSALVEISPKKATLSGKKDYVDEEKSVSALNEWETNICRLKDKENCILDFWAIPFNIRKMDGLKNAYIMKTLNIFVGMIRVSITLSHDVPHLQKGKKYKFQRFYMEKGNGIFHAHSVPRLSTILLS